MENLEVSSHEIYEILCFFSDPSQELSLSESKVLFYDQSFCKLLNSVAYWYRFLDVLGNKDTDHRIQGSPDHTDPAE